MISIILTLLIIGVLLWAINQVVPMDAKIKVIINAVIIICVILWLARVLFGVHVMGLR